MRIISTQYTLEHNSLDIYVAGCNGNPHCHQCHNPESWDFNQGHIYNKAYFNQHIKEKIKSFDLMVNNIMIFGGEPNDNDHDELLHMLMDLKSLGKKIWLFTRYSINDVPEFEYTLCDYIKTGKYESRLITNDNIQYGIKLASSNQTIYKMEKYNGIKDN